MKNGHQFATLAVHAGEPPCRVTGALDTPIYQSTTFVSASADEMAAVYGEEKFGYMYTRYGNPTIRALEEKVQKLEGGGSLHQPADRKIQGGRSRSSLALALRGGL